MQQVGFDTNSVRNARRSLYLGFIEIGRAAKIPTQLWISLRRSTKVTAVGVKRGSGPMLIAKSRRRRHMRKHTH